MHVRAPGADFLRNTTPQGLGRALHGAVFGEPRRHGKWLLEPADNHLLLFHFGMTGSLHWTSHPESDPPDSHDQVVFETDAGELRTRSQRKFGGVWLLAGSSIDYQRVTGPLGPDAAELAHGDFRALLSRRHGPIKGALMDQALLAGLGNQLSDEILWRAGIHPERNADELSPEQLAEIYRAMRHVLRESMRRGHIPVEPGWLQKVRDDQNARCPRCGGPLSKKHIAGRSARLCPSCQPP